jgi:hypothetical protein
MDLLARLYATNRYIKMQQLQNVWKYLLKINSFEPIVGITFKIEDVSHKK